MYLYDLHKDWEYDIKTNVWNVMTTACLWYYVFGSSTAQLHQIWAKVIISIQFLFFILLNNHTAGEQVTINIKQVSQLE